jgi:NNP family nitrate/nitrite transporter-like MFS transporter
MNNRTQNANYKWYILILAATTNAVAVAIPSMSMSVLLAEITKELNLSLVQAGLVWGIGALPAIVTGLLGGAFGDRFGPKRILTISCLLVGVAGALRGFSTDFLSLAAMVFLFGVLTPVITMNNIKTAGTWFPNQELGLANGVLSMGMALGFLIGSMISATLLSPWLGGWRNVFFLYGIIAAALAIPWYFTRPMQNLARSERTGSALQSILQGMSRVAKLRNIWLLGLTLLGITGSIQGLLGYLPLHLRSLGWSAASADGALSAFHTVSMIFVLPIALWSDRLGSRKTILIGTAILTAAGIGLLSFAEGGLVWGAVIIAGVVRDGFMAIFLTMVVETKGVGPSYSGTATGFVMIFMGIGSLLAPPLGNSLAEIAPGIPFLFWAALTIFGIMCIALITEREPAFDSHSTVEIS